MIRNARIVKCATIVLSLILVHAALLPGQSNVPQVAGHPLSVPGIGLAIFIESEDGVKLTRLFRNGATSSESIDIEEDDVVTSVNGIAIEDLATFRQSIDRIVPPAVVRMKLRRDSKNHEIEFKKSEGAFSIPRSGFAKGENGGGERVRLNPEEISKRIDKILEANISPDKPGLSLAIWSGGTDILTKARGLANLQTGTALTSDTRMAIDSISKQFTGLAIAMLSLQGRLSLEDDIKKHLPELSGLQETVKLKNMLSHTSGLRDYAGLLSLAGSRTGASFSRADLLELIQRQDDLQFKPETQFRYSNTNFALLPIVIERITKEPFEDWMQANLFDSLSMNSACFPTTSQTITNFANLYSTEQGKSTQVFPALEINGDGGMISSAPDLIKWAQELVKARVIPTSARDLLTTPAILADGSSTNYGLGIGVSDHRGIRRYAHSGSSPGSQSILHIYPDENFAICILANNDDAQVSEIARQITELYLGRVFDESAPHRKSTGPRGAIMITEEDFSGNGTEEGNPISNAELDLLAGQYVLEDDRQLKFEAVGNRLHLKLAAGIRGVPLVHLGKNRFRFKPGNWEISFRQFEGPAQSVTVHLTENSISRRGPGDVSGFRVSTINFSEEKLKQFEGRYHCSQLDAQYRIVRKNGNLVLSHPDIGEHSLIHHANDRFGVQQNIIREINFLRRNPDDRNSPVVALRATSVIWSADARFEKMAPDQ